VKENDKEIERVISDALNEVLDEIFTHSQENLYDMKAIDTGNLMKSGTPNFTEKPVGKFIHYQAPYAVPVEYGRNPGSYPPFEPIYKWVKRRLGVKNENEAKKIAWAIINKIKTEGVYPRPFMRKAIEQTQDLKIR